MALNITPEVRQRMERQIAEYEQDALSEHRIAEALLDHADEHRRRAYASEDQIAAAKAALADNDA